MPLSLPPPFPVSRLTITFLFVALSAALSAPADAQVSEQLVQAYLWPMTAADFRQAEAALAADPSLMGVTRMQMHDLEELMRRGPAARSGAAAFKTGDSLDQFVVEGPGGRAIPVFVRLPSRYAHDSEWPLIFAMHGGPPGNARPNLPDPVGQHRCGVDSRVQPTSGGRTRRNAA